MVRLGYPEENLGVGAMLGKIARGAFLLVLAVMIVSWAMSVSNSRPVDPESDQPIDRMYS
jgi:hypothetical protein